jgi:hypothetical protein
MAPSQALSQVKALLGTLTPNDWFNVYCVSGNEPQILGDRSRWATPHQQRQALTFVRRCQREGGFGFDVHKAFKLAAKMPSRDDCYSSLVIVTDNSGSF